VGGGHADVGSSASAEDLAQATSLHLDGGMMTSDESGSDTGSSDDEATTTTTAATVAEDSPPANPEVAEKTFDSLGDASSTTEAASTTSTGIDYSAYLKDSGSADEASTTTVSQSTTAMDDSKYFNPDSSVASDDAAATTTATPAADDAITPAAAATENAPDADLFVTTTTYATGAPVQEKRLDMNDIFGRSATESAWDSLDESPSATEASSTTTAAEPFDIPAGESAEQFIDKLPEAPVTTTSAAAADNDAVAAMAQMFKRSQALLLQQKKAGKHSSLVSVKLYKRK